MKLSIHFITIILLITFMYGQGAPAALTCNDISNTINNFIDEGKLDQALSLANNNLTKEGEGCDAFYVVALSNIFIKFNDFEQTRSLFINAMKKSQDEEYNKIELEYNKLSSLLSQLNFIQKQYKNDRNHADAIVRYNDLLNGNKYCDQSEPFIDNDGDNKWDPEERYTDSNNNGKWDEGETYADDNLNGKWDDEEEFEDWSYSDIGIIYLYMADVYKNQKDYSNAVKNLKEATNINPKLEIYTKNMTNIAKLIAMQGDDHLRLNQISPAIEKYSQAISISPNLSTVLFNISIAYMKIEEFEKAIVHLTKVVELDSNKYKAFHKLGYCYQRLASNSSTEIDNNQEISERDKNYTVSINNFKKSITILNYSENSEIKYLSPYHALGVSFMQMFNYKDATRILNEVIIKDEKYFKAYETLGMLHKDSTDPKYQSYELALDYFKRGAKIKPEHHIIKFRISQIYNILADQNNESKNHTKMNENLTNAKKFAKQSLKINKKYGGSHFELGYAELYLCNKSSAIKSLKKAGKLDKRYRSEVKRILKNVKDITNHCK